MELTLAQRFNNSRLDTFFLKGVVWKPSPIRTNGNVFTMECDQKTTKTTPLQILSVKQIKTVHIEWCCNLDLAETFMMLADVPNLVNLHLMNCSIKQLPPEIWTLYKLKHLGFSNNTYVGNNEFETFPPEIGILDNLRELDLGTNRKFKKFPPEVEKMGNLEFINLGALYSLPKNIELIPHLKHLRLIKSEIVPAHIEPLVDRPNGLESVSVDDFMYNAFRQLAEKYPNFSVYPEDSGHSSRGNYL